MTIDLPARRGPRPTTTPTNSHTQLDQQPPDHEQRDRLAAAVFALDGVREQESLISVPGARALWLAVGAAGPAEAFMVGHEFAHLHPGDDQSLHLMLRNPSRGRPSRPAGPSCTRSPGAVSYHRRP